MEEYSLYWVNKWIKGEEEPALNLTIPTPDAIKLALVLFGAGVAVLVVARATK